MRTAITALALALANLSWVPAPSRGEGVYTAVCTQSVPGEWHATLHLPDLRPEEIARAHVYTEYHGGEGIGSYGFLTLTVSENWKSVSTLCGYGPWAATTRRIVIPR